MALQEDILSLVLKDLPNQTAGVLKSYLDEAEKTKKEMENIRVRCKDLETFYSKNKQEMIDLNTQIVDLKAKLKSQDDLEKLKTDIEKSQRDLNLTLAVAEKTSAYRERDAVMELARTVFRNPTFIKSETRETPVAMPGYSGGSGYIQRETTRTETTERTD